MNLIVSELTAEALSKCSGIDAELLIQTGTRKLSGLEGCTRSRKPVDCIASTASEAMTRNDRSSGWRSRLLSPDQELHMVSKAVGWDFSRKPEYG
ncbi:hypothetical protein KC337_g112 [Hortaea werneckii]|nr:hypothetical protein KC337_g112 [Hortaea werneckii]